MGAWLSEAAAWLAQPNGAGWVTLLASLSAFGLPVSQGRLSGLQEPGTSPRAHASPHPRQPSGLAPAPGTPGPGGLWGPLCGQQGKGWGWPKEAMGGGEARPPNRVPKRRGCLRPTQGPRWEGAALALAEPRCLVGGAALGPSGLSARAAPGTPASWHRGGVGTERPSPLGRTSGPEPRALRSGPGSSPVPRTRAGQGSEQAAAWVPRAPVGSPPPHAPAAASRGQPVAHGPRGVAGEATAPRSASSSSDWLCTGWWPGADPHRCPGASGSWWGGSPGRPPGAGRVRDLAVAHPGR